MVMVINNNGEIKYNTVQLKKHLRAVFKWRRCAARRFRDGVERGQGQG